MSPDTKKTELKGKIILMKGARDQRYFNRIYTTKNILVIVSSTKNILVIVSTTKNILAIVSTTKNILAIVSTTKNILVISNRPGFPVTGTLFWEFPHTHKIPFSLGYW